MTNSLFELVDSKRRDEEIRGLLAVGEVAIESYFVLKCFTCDRVSRCRNPGGSDRAYRLGWRRYRDVDKAACPHCREHAFEIV